MLIVVIAAERMAPAPGSTLVPGGTFPSDPPLRASARDPCMVHSCPPFFYFSFLSSGKGCTS